MDQDLQARIDAARHVRMSQDAKERQRRSFAYGNTHIENERITKATIDEAAERLSSHATRDAASH
ncbi:MAG: hypothetical protein IT303_15230 [Dehalococcoidia bacterium]|nr:hypothetical protein [Dehalococcoidia bacterium]